ncbi:hypothetical protein MRB53_001317 [Persea americana]|uniref:Uncharacterized protein n=1 Tax=Persea americana TaxID=3435 RepID=A0ACC2MRC9_PERAE|nr:hypothetical protein MRB53_001317 [Persea americana]
MANNNRTKEFEVSNAYARMTINEEEEGGLIVTGEDVEEGGDVKIDFRYCLVGRFLTNKVINFPAMKNTMALLWRPGREVCIKDPSPTLFLFQFFHEIDVNWVLETRPWTFDKHILLVKRLEENEQPHNVPLFHTSFWVQIYNLPIGFLSEKILKDIGNYIGLFLDSNENNLMGVWRNYMRVRVSIDVRKPLQRRMRIKKAGGEWIWIDFKYECLNIFCFICGLLGHTEQQCPKVYECSTGEMVKAHGHWMKAPNRRNQMNSGERWLRSTPPEELGMKNGNNVESAVAMAVDSVIATNSGNILRTRGDGGADGGIVGSNKEVGEILPSNSESRSKGKSVVGTTIRVGLDKESEEDLKPGIIVSDPKRRRSQDGLHRSVGLGEGMTYQMLEISVDSKNGPAVGPVLQAHRDQ